MAFQTDLQESERGRADSRGIAHIVVGIRQPTNTTVRLADGRATVSETFGSENDFGDGTVPLTGAIGHDERLDTNIAVRVPENHSALQCNRFVLDQVQELLTASPVRRRDLSSVSVRARVPDLVVEGEPRGGPPHGGGCRCRRTRGRSAVLAGGHGQHRAGKVIAREVVKLSADGSGRASFEELPPGTHTVAISGATPAAGVRTVTSSTMVWPTLPA